MSIFLGSREIKEIYLGNKEISKVFRGSQLVWELQQSESILISSATVGIHPNYVWIESSELADVKGILEGSIQKVVLNDKVMINHLFEYDRWNNNIIQLEGHPDNPRIYEEIRNALGFKDTFSDVKVSIYLMEQI